MTPERDQPEHRPMWRRVLGLVELVLVAIGVLAPIALMIWGWGRS